MNILAFDTSNNFSSVAISRENEILYASKATKPHSQAENLISMIEEALESTRLNYGDINYLAVSQGPGSFTGIRIGLAAAKGILLAAPNIRPVCVNNFQMINYRVREQYKFFDYAICAVNAYRNQLYIQYYTKKGEDSELLMLSIEEAKILINNLSGVKVLGGSGWHLLYDTINYDSKDVVILPRFAYPDARFACKIAYQQIVQHKVNGNIEPLYIRPPDAKLPKTKLHF